MSTALLSEDGSLARYPYTIEDLRADHPGTIFFEPVDADTLAHFRVVVVQASTAPEVTLEQTLTEAAPVLVDGVWTQQWAVAAAAPELVAERQAAAKAALVAAFTAALEAHYDAKARERRYDSRYTCALRAGYAGPFQAEGAAFAGWMDTCNAIAYTALEQVEAGQRAMPESPSALINELPELVWP